MFITDVSIRRPVVAWVMSLILIVFGIFVFSKLPVRELPDGLQPPVVQLKLIINQRQPKSLIKKLHKLLRM